MSLKTLRKDWHLLGASDPFWAILTDPEKRGNRWRAEDFFSTGVAEIQQAMAHLDALRLPARRRRALDFGCGAGRLTQPLAEHFEQVTGVDISPSMLDLARRHNRQGDRCRFVLNEKRDLGQFGDAEFDFIYSSITLQHMPPPLIRGYVREFARVLAPGGAMMFQVPSHRLDEVPPLGRRLLNWAYRMAIAALRRRAPVIEMHGVAHDGMVRLLERAGVRLVEAMPDQSAGSQWVSFRYLAARP